MDDRQFDAFTRQLGSRFDRRSATQMLASGAITALGLVASQASEAKKKKKGKGKKKKNKKGKDICLPTKELCAGVTVCDTEVDDCRGSRYECPCWAMTSPSDDHFDDCLGNGTCAWLCTFIEPNLDENLPYCTCRATPDGQPLQFAAGVVDACSGPVCDAVTDCPVGQACWALACGGRCVDVCTPSMWGL